MDLRVIEAFITDAINTKVLSNNQHKHDKNIYTDHVCLKVLTDTKRNGMYIMEPYDLEKYPREMALIMPKSVYDKYRNVRGIDWGIVSVYDTILPCDYKILSIDSLSNIKLQKTSKSICKFQNDCVSASIIQSLKKENNELTNKTQELINELSDTKQKLLEEEVKSKKKTNDDFVISRRLRKENSELINKTRQLTNEISDMKRKLSDYQEKIKGLTDELTE